MIEHVNYVWHTISPKAKIKWSAKFELIKKLKTKVSLPQLTRFHLSVRSAHDKNFILEELLFWSLFEAAIDLAINGLMLFSLASSDDNWLSNRVSFQIHYETELINPFEVFYLDIYGTTNFVNLMTGYCTFFLTSRLVYSQRCLCSTCTQWGILTVDQSQHSEEIRTAERFYSGLKVRQC